MEKIKCRDCDEIYDPSLPHFCSNKNKGTEKERLEKRIEKLEKKTESSISKGEKQQNNEDENNAYWFTGYIFAGIIYYESQQFVKTTIDGLIVLIIAISAGFYYYRFKQRLKIKNGFLRSLYCFVIIAIAAMFSIGFLTVII